MRPAPARAARAARAGGALALAVPFLALAPASAVAGQEADCSEISASDTTDYETTSPSAPHALMEVDQALARLRASGRRPGQGVTVAVVDSGVASAADGVISVVARRDTGNKDPEPSDYHGTAVAGLIAGKPRPRGAGGAVGIAPFARILDVQVYDDPDASPDDPSRRPITIDGVVAGLDEVIAAVPTFDIRIVNISLVVPQADAIRERIARLVSMGVVVVAPTGNRGDPSPPDLPADYAEGHRMGEDAAPYVHPADVDGVVGVNATPGGLDGADPTAFVLENSNTDVAAPTAGAVSYSLRGQPCLLRVPATSFAAAEVSGALALLQSAYDEPVAASLRRLLTTANGRPDIPNTLVGAGEVQLDEALTRPLAVGERGEDLGAGIVQHRPQVLRVPEEPDDLLAATREDAVWWGLGGGGVLLLALILRPVLAWRRPAPTARPR